MEGTEGVPRRCKAGGGVARSSERGVVHEAGGGGRGAPGGSEVAGRSSDDGASTCQEGWLVLNTRQRCPAAPPG